MIIETFCYGGYMYMYMAYVVPGVHPKNISESEMSSHIVTGVAFMGTTPGNKTWFVCRLRSCPKLGP